MDATLKGIGGIWGNKAYSAVISSEILQRVAISQLELHNIVVAARLWAPLWRNKAICIRFDNESVVLVRNSGKT